MSKGELKEIGQMEGEQATQILSLLYTEKNEHAQNLSDRQFKITTQTLALHIAIIGGLVVYTGNITITQRIIASLGLTVLMVY